MKPTVGRIVHVNLPMEMQSNGAAIAPGIITRVWDERKGMPYPYINVTVFRDASLTPLFCGSMEHADFKPIGYGGPTWFWPPRE